MIRSLEVLDVLVLGFHGKNRHVDGRLLRVVDGGLLLRRGRLYDGILPFEQFCSLRGLVERFLDNLLVGHRIERLGRKIKQDRRCSRGAVGFRVYPRISFVLQLLNDAGNLFSSRNSLLKICTLFKFKALTKI